MTVTVRAEGLVKHFGETKALDGLDLEVHEGTVLGVLGPNGAGKTTAVRILTTLLHPDAGRATVAGIDVTERPQDVRRLIGLSGQYAAVDEYLTGYENLEMFGRLYRLGGRAAKARATELLEQFDLADAASRIAKTYSGGMRRRLDLAAALVARPKILFLDEPTTGLDPRSRMGLWAVIAEQVRQGATLLLTTQYLEEADQLADRIAVIDRGRVIAEGTSDDLKGQVGGERLEVVVATADQVAAMAQAVAAISLGAPTVDVSRRRITASVSGGSGVLVEAVRAADVAGVEIQDLALHRPTLDDVFLTLTGRGTESVEADPSTPAASRDERGEESR